MCIRDRGSSSISRGRFSQNRSFQEFCPYLSTLRRTGLGPNPLILPYSRSHHHQPPKCPISRSLSCHGHEVVFRSKTASMGRTARHRYQHAAGLLANVVCGKKQPTRMVLTGRLFGSRTTGKALVTKQPGTGLLGIESKPDRFQAPSW